MDMGNNSLEDRMHVLAKKIYARDKKLPVIERGSPAWHAWREWRKRNKLEWRGWGVSSDRVTVLCEYPPREFDSFEEQTVYSGDITAKVRGAKNAESARSHEIKYMEPTSVDPAEPLPSPLPLHDIRAEKEAMRYKLQQDGKKMLHKCSGHSFAANNLEFKAKMSEFPVGSQFIAILGEVWG